MIPPTAESADIILVTDGLETCDADPCALAAQLAQEGIAIRAHVVGFGLTSQDINNTSVPLSVKEALEQVYYPQIEELIAQLRTYAEEWANQRHQAGKRCGYLSILTHTLGAFCKTWLLRAGFLDGKQGLLLAVVNAQYTFNKYTALWALSHGYSEKVSL